MGNSYFIAYGSIYITLFSDQICKKLKAYHYWGLYLMFVALIAVPPALLSYSAYHNWLVPGFWALFAFLSGLTMIVVTAVVFAQQMNAERGAQVFMIATTIKILACLAFVLIFILITKPNKVVFMADFFVIYLLNTAFEIYCLLRNLRNQKLR